VSENEHHHGRTIKKYRDRKGMTQQELAEKWPRSGGGVGVDWHYVQVVEYGKKKVTDPYTLRELCAILDCPEWEFGLSEYDPFQPSALPGAGVRLYQETLSVAETLIKQTLAMRRIASLPEVEQSAHSLDALFHYFLTYTPPTSRLEPQFLSLYAQEQSIQGLMYFENKKYKKALETFQGMYRTAKDLKDPVLQVHALQKVGVELNRAGQKQKAVDALDEARDLSFSTSKHVATFANAYLGHIYAAAGDPLRFERAINTAMNLADSIKDTYGDGTDFVFHKFSGILQLRSRGYLRIGEPKKTLALHDELKRQVSLDANLWLDFRLHLYRARAYLMLKDVESCIGAAREFFRDVKDWQSPHRTARGYELLQELQEAGYAEVKDVREFKDELLEAMQK